MVFKAKYLILAMMYEPFTWGSLGFIALLNWTPNFEGQPAWLVGFAYLGFALFMVLNKMEDWKNKKIKNQILNDVRTKFIEDKITLTELDTFLDKHK